jgi:hypothetical protein
MWKRTSVGFKASIYGCANVSRVSHTPQKTSKHSVRWMVDAHLPIPPHTFSGFSTFWILKSDSTRFLAHAFSRTRDEHWLAEGRSPKLVPRKLENFKCCQKVRVNRGLVKTVLGRCVQVARQHRIYSVTVFMKVTLWSVVFAQLAIGHWAHIWSSAKLDDQTSRLIGYPLCFTLGDLRTVISTFRGYRHSFHRNVRTASQEVQRSLPSTNHPSNRRYIIRHLKQRH